MKTIPIQIDLPAAPIAANQLAYSPAQAAQLSAISKAFIYKEWLAGRGPRKTKIGRRTVITHEALHDWLRSMEDVTKQPMAPQAQS